MGFLQFIQSKIALRRVGRYLELPELNTYVENTPPPDASPEEQQVASVTIRDGTFAWVDPSGKVVRGIEDEEKPDKKKERRRSSKKGDKETEPPSSVTFADKELQASIHSVQSSVSHASEDGSTAAPVMALTNITTTIPAGSLVAVVGTVGSGKSSLLSAILGEMEPVEATRVHIPRDPSTPNEGFISYATQSPWVVNDTLRGNILFGRPFDQERYDQVVEAAALLDDLAVLPAGDQTEIGEHGINLSGGQKARVSLARAMYGSSTKLILLDDPLSAVDSHVGEHLFTQAICGDVCKGATRILVTHASHVLSRCDIVIVMEKGTIKHQGPYTELVAKGVDFAGAVDVSKHEKDDDGNVAEDDADATEATEATDAVAEKKGEVMSDEKKEAMRKSGKKLVSDEEKAEGKVTNSAYWNYARAGGFLPALSVLLCAMFGRGSDIAGAFWLSKWSEEGFQATSDGLVMSDEDTRFYLGIYSAFALCGLLGITLQGICFANLRLRASRRLHRDLTQSILRAPVAFFDVTPIGRVLNRFAADMDKVDLELVQSLQQGLSMTFSIIVSN
jgi:ATP-binding cassette subfamily C (CFTR/MRP) protein 1